MFTGRPPGDFRVLPGYKRADFIQTLAPNVGNLHAFGWVTDDKKQKRFLVRRPS
jgi:hypothetical protein